MFGATPCNVAQKLVDGGDYKLIAGVNLPMLLRAMTYRHEPLDLMVTRALAGGAQGVMPVSTVAPQKQTRKNHDSDAHQHQQ
jgi:PTS system ascorbate-specific IIA component